MISIFRPPSTRLKRANTSGPMKSSIGGMSSESVPNTRPCIVVTRN
jgi:hypothetical protein